MRCVICDVALSEKEVSLDQDMKSNPCTTCNQIINDTAYSDGFVADDSIILLPEDIEEELAEENEEDEDEGRRGPAMPFLPLD